MKKNLLLTLIVLTLIQTVRASPRPPAYPSTFSPLYTDDFETESNWEIFEEVVNGDPCYGTGIGSVTRNMDTAYLGEASLQVWANQALSFKSNHVIGHKKISETGITARVHYQIHAYIAPGTQAEGQTGPEFSMQNTRQNLPGSSTTAIAGIQYIANPTWQTGYWNVWHNGTWATFWTTPTLQAGTWYTLTLEADYFTDQYTSFSIQGGGLDLTGDLSAYHMAEETRGFNPAFVITLESENLWNNCGTAGVFDYQVFYDEIAVIQENWQVFLPSVMR